MQRRTGSCSVGVGYVDAWHPPPINESAVRAVLREVGDQIPVQFGGALRDLDTIERCLDDGLS